MQTKVRKQFLLVAEEVHRRHGSDKWVDVSADGTVDEVEEAIWSIVGNMEVASDIASLWS